MRFVSFALLCLVPLGCSTGERLAPEASVPTSTIPTGEALPVDAHPIRPLEVEEIALVESAIVDLTSSDFGVYTRAATQLIEIGEPVVIALIDARNLQRIDFGVSSPAIEPVVHRILEDLASDRLVLYLGSPSKGARRSATIHLAARNEIGAVPHLLEKFPSSPRSLRARFFDALHELTGVPEDRPLSWEEGAEEHIEAWTTWWIARQPSPG